jgi:hypothetical protein
MFSLRVHPNLGLKAQPACHKWTKKNNIIAHKSLEKSIEKGSKIDKMLRNGELSINFYLYNLTADEH